MEIRAENFYHCMSSNQCEEAVLYNKYVLKRELMDTDEVSLPK